MIIFFALVLIPEAPLYGIGKRFPRWVEATVPMLFILFLVPGIVYGLASGTFRSNRDIADAMGETFASLGPYIVLAFFAAQFIEAFKYIDDWERGNYDFNTDEQIRNFIAQTSKTDLVNLNNEFVRNGKYMNITVQIRGNDFNDTPYFSWDAMD